MDSSSAECFLEMINSFKEYLILCFNDVPTSVIVGLLLLFCLGTIVFLAFFSGKKRMKWLASLLLVESLFLILLLSVLVRKVRAERSYDFVLFWSYQAIQGGKTDLLTQNIANVLTFIPIGFLLGCVFDRMRWWKVLLIGLGFSMLIEFLQFVLKRGFTEFDDVFHNALGCIIGYGVYVWGVWLVRMVIRKRIDGEHNRP